MQLSSYTPGPKALFPFFIFITCFLGAGLLLEDFYAFPSPIAVLLGIATAVLIFQGSATSKIDTLLEGCGDPKIITMCLIYLLAGAFASVSGAMGGVESVVNLGMDFIAVEYLPMGIFLIAAFLSISTGTSVGSIVALGPVALSLADQSGISLALMGATLLGGAMFGDNLSIISDTTIASTQSLGVNMKDKFKMNLYIALPAALATIVLLFFLGQDASGISTVVEANDGYSFLKILPYILVVLMAVMGVNVFYVLFLGIIAAGAIGIFHNDFNLLLFARKVYDGFLSMTDIFLLSLLTGGLAALVSKAGGIEYMLKKIQKKIRSKSSAQIGVGSLVGLTNMAIANNTVSIIITGPIAKEIGQTYKIDPRKSAALLDIFACIVQGMLPYGAQVLLILSFAQGSFNYLDLIGNAWYLLLLFAFSLLAILWKGWDLRFGKH